ncbi:hypothetical protein MPER_09537, partial [Moniliophthora perniciosa FA553]
LDITHFGIHNNPPPLFHHQSISTSQQPNPTFLPTLAPATRAHDVPAGHSSLAPVPNTSPATLPNNPPTPAAPPIIPPTPAAPLNIPPTPAAPPIIPAQPASDQIPEKENDPNVRPKAGRKRKHPESNSNQSAAGDEAPTVDSKRPQVLTQKMVLDKQDKEEKAAKKAKKKQADSAPRKARATTKEASAMTKKASATTKKKSTRKN